MNELPVTREQVSMPEGTQKRWAKLLTHNGILYLYGMTGFGKTTQATAYAESQYKEWVRFSAAEDEFLSTITQWLSAHKKSRTKSLLLLDDLQWVVDVGARQILFNLLLQGLQVRGLRIMLISRAAPPPYLSPLWATQQMAVEDQECLLLGKEQIKELLLVNPALAELPAEVQQRLTDACLQATKGYAMGIAAFLHRCGENPQDLPTATVLSVRDVENYLDSHLITQWTPSRRNAAVRLSVYPAFTREMAFQLLGDQTDAVLRDFIEIGNFLTFTAPDTYTFAPFFWRYLEKRLRARPEAEWKPLYETAARNYENRRDAEQALRCYKLASRTDKISELVIYLSENADGCAFARIARPYMDALSPDWEQRNPKILGAKALLSAYRMRPQECEEYLERLREMAENEQKCLLRGDAIDAYARTVIACPYDTADALKDNLLKFVGNALRNGSHLSHIMPTGNMPSLISGGLDLLPWEKNKKLLYPVIKAAAETIMGPEAVGIADASMGEILYEQNQKSKAIAYLTKARSAADLSGTVRVQYAVTGIMARLFQSEGQNDTAESILRDMTQKATQQHYTELLPNIEASLAQCALLKNDAVDYNDWLTKSAPNEHDEFYITARYRLLVKAQVYTALGRELEALYILGLLEEYATLYRRTYLHIEILTLKAIILYRRGEEWREELETALTMAHPYGLVRIFADRGAALLPLLDAMNFKAEPADGKRLLPLTYTTVIHKECKAMAALYPNYLKAPLRFGSISDKEFAVLRLMAQGRNNSQIADELAINLGTAKFHVKNIMKKLQAENRTVAVKVAQEEGLL